MTEVEEETAKVVILGSSGVGKTCIALRYVQDAFTETEATIAASYLSKSIETDGRRFKLQIWDTAGQERFKGMAALFYKGAHAAIICYEIISRDTFEGVKKWVSELQANTSGSPPIFIIAGNKKDMEASRQVPTMDGKNFATSIGAEFFETSAKTGEGISALFEFMGHALARSIQKKSEKPGKKRNGGCLLL
ncbi:Rab31 protein [Pelomyxa schiedti]|nr:Rab31 protein [Pelomyxa schiedti]